MYLIRKGKNTLKRFDFTMLNSVHAAVRNLYGFIQGDKRCLQTKSGQNPSEFLFNTESRDICSAFDQQKNYKKTPNLLKSSHKAMSTLSEFYIIIINYDWSITI